mmetsp:Transcript_9441/g.19350  ORF Transcript_9441/g.19350 Transcript_9441/m.19350 type:complete len:104 (-) Transcript_9441:1596-1907(-)
MSQALACSNQELDRKTVGKRRERMSANDNVRTRSLLQNIHEGKISLSILMVGIVIAYFSRSDMNHPHVKTHPKILDCSICAMFSISSMLCITNQSPKVTRVHN